MEEIIVNGIKYVPADTIKMAKFVDGLPFCVIRTYSAGVHAGYLKSREGKEVVLANAIRIWQWAGAFTLSELAVNGTTKPEECKFAVAVPEITLTEAIEIIPCTETGKNSILGVKTYAV